MRFLHRFVLYKRALMELIGRILKFKISYLIILFFIILYLRQENIIINFPNYLDYLIFLIVFISFYMLDSRLTAIKENDFVFKLFNIVVLIIFGFFFTAILKVPINTLIINSAYGKHKEENCKIDNFISGRFQKLYFEFNGKNESIPFKNEDHLSRENIIENYQIKINYRNSILGTQVIKNTELVRK